MLLQVFLLIIASIPDPSTPARILGIPAWPAVSHENFLVPIWRELSLRGHQVTVLTTRPLQDASLVNLTEIDVSFMYGIARRPEIAKRLSTSPWTFAVLFERMGEALEEVLRAHRVQAMLRDEKIGFDLVMVEPHHPLVFAFAAKYRAPIVAQSSLAVFPNIHDSQGNPTHPVASPNLFIERVSGSSLRALIKKTISLIENVWYRLYFWTFVVPESDRIARKYLGNDIPYLGDVVDNISLVLSNVNPILNTVRPNVPSVVEVSLVHINNKVALPKDLQDYLDSSNNGVVYFSLGTHVVASNIDNSTLSTITEALGELPYDVLWKYEKEDLPGKPPNVALRKWLPQQAILNHPNVKLFITQGGAQSLEESIYAEVPIVGIPFMFDQPANIKQVVDKGLGEQLNPTELTKKAFVETVIKVVTDPSYKSNVIKAKNILDDQPIKGLDKAVWWVEYLLRHDRVDHLKGAGARMSLIEYFMLDVLAFLVVVSALVVSVIYKLTVLFKKVLTIRKHKKE